MDIAKMPHTLWQKPWRWLQVHVLFFAALIEFLDKFAYGFVSGQQLAKRLCLTLRLQQRSG
jgi:hypothetical protein